MLGRDRSGPADCLLPLVFRSSFVGVEARNEAGGSMFEARPGLSLPTAYCLLPLGWSWGEGSSSIFFVDFNQSLISFLNYAIKDFTWKDFLMLL